MFVSTIEVTRGLTINTGNYNSMRLEVRVVAELTADENEVIALANLHNIVVDELERQIFDTDVPEPIKLANVAILRKDR